MKRIMLMTLCCFVMTAVSAERKPALRKVSDVVIYKDTNWFSAFPSVVKNGRKDIMVAFRRAPERRMYGEAKTIHADPNSYLVAVRSKDGGETWTKNPELIYAHPRGGSQDPCMLKLKDGTILCASYWWANVRKPLPSNKTYAGNFVLCGGYLLRSTDNGKTWSEPILPPTLDDNEYCGVDGKPYPVYNRGAMCETKDGRVLWAVPGHKEGEPSSLYLMVSEDKGLTWEKSGVVAKDENIGFNEASVYETPSGDIVVFIRTLHNKHRGYVSRSKDGGKTFTWEPLSFAGHPHHALRLPDKRVLLTYGHRPSPRCIKARILNPECTDFATAEEFVIYDGPTKSGDIGYPWSVMIDKKHVLTVYYYNHNGGTRFIGGTILEIN